MAEKVTEHWTVDRRVPVIVILTTFCALVVQAAVLIWWLSAWMTKMDARMTAVEVSSAAQQARIESIAGDTQRMQVAAATVGAQLQSVRDSLSEVKDAQREQLDLLRDFLKGASQ